MPGCIPGMPGLNPPRLPHPGRAPHPPPRLPQPPPGKPKPAMPPEPYSTPEFGIRRVDVALCVLVLGDAAVADGDLDAVRARRVGLAAGLRGHGLLLSRGGRELPPAVLAGAVVMVRSRSEERAHQALDAGGGGCGRRRGRRQRRRLERVLPANEAARVVDAPMQVARVRRDAGDHPLAHRLVGDVVRVHVHLGPASGAEAEARHASGANR